MSNSTSPSAAAGITGSLPDSFSLKVQIAVFAALAFWNSLELVALIFLTFKRYEGLYFWSLLIASAGIVPYTIGFLVKYFTDAVPSTIWIGCLLLTIGWWTMVTGQSVVLWSRLHLVLDQGYRGQIILKMTAFMIVIDALVFHIPTTTLTWLDNYSTHPQKYVRVFTVFEKLQMTGFFVQEMILSSLYIFATARILRMSLQDNTRKLMYQLVVINVIIMAGDIALLGIEYGNLYIQETMFKPVLYSLKLKLEFAVLSKLVKFVGGGNGVLEESRKRSVVFAQEDEGQRKHSSVLANGDISEFVDVKRTDGDVTHASTVMSDRRRKSRPSAVGQIDEDETDINFAGFQHIEDFDCLGKRESSSD